MTTPQPQPPLPDFQSYISQYPNIPDTAYDALREKFFNEQFRPALAQRGERGFEAWRDAFMQSTERPGKSAMPRTALVGAEALKSFTDPLAGAIGLAFPKVQQDVQGYTGQKVQEAAQEAQRQGVWTPGYQFAGAALGQAPYFAAGGEVAEGLTGAEGFTELSRLARTAAVGLTQGVYDAAKADNGHRLQSGLVGTAIGTGIAGGLETIGSIRGALVKQGLSDGDAQAVEQMAKGTGSEEQQTIASRVVAENPQALKTVEDTIKQQSAAADRAGVPRKTPAASPNKNLTVSGFLPNGKDFKIEGYDPRKQGGVLAERLGQYLDQGAFVESVEGDPQLTTKFWQQMETVNNAKKMNVVDVGARTSKVSPQAKQTIPVPVEQPPEAIPQPSVSTSITDEVPFPEEEDLRDSKQILADLDREMSQQQEEAPPIEETLQQKLARIQRESLAKRQQEGVLPEGRGDLTETPFEGAVRRVPRKTFSSEDIPEYDKIEELPNGTIRNRDTGETFPDLQSAIGKPFAARDYAEQRRRMRIKYISPEDAKGAAFVDPEGRTINVGNTFLHDDVAQRLGMSSSDEAVQRGYIQVSRDGVSYDPSTASESNIRKGIQAAVVIGNGTEPIHVSDGNLWRSYDPQELIANDFDFTQVRPLKVGKDYPHNWFATPSGRFPKAGVNYVSAPEHVTGGGAFVDPQGRIIDLGDIYVHNDVAQKLGLGGLDGALNKGYIQVTGDSVTYDPGASPSNIRTALQVATHTGALYLKDPNLSEVYLNDGYTWLKYDVNELKANDFNYQDVRPLEYGSSSGKPLATVGETPSETPPDITRNVPSLYRQNAIAHRFYSPGARNVQDAIIATGQPGALSLAGQAPEEATGLTIPRGENKPAVIFSRADRGDVFHEYVHALLAHPDLGNLSGWIADHVPNYDPEMFSSLKRMFTASGVRDTYSDSSQWPEELLAYASTAFRTDDQHMLQYLSDIDEDFQHLSNWMAGVSGNLLEKAAEAPDSVAKRALERKFGEVLRRSTNEFNKLAEDPLGFGDVLDMRDGKFQLYKRATGEWHEFADRKALNEHLDTNYQEPLGTPELVDLSSIPEGLPRAAVPTHTFGRAPIQNPPPDIPPKFGAGPAGGRIFGGLSSLSFFIRPFYEWLDTVAKRAEWPELYNTFRALDEGVREHERFSAPYVSVINDLINKPNLPQSSALKYLESKDALRPAVANHLNLSDSQVADLHRFEKEFIAPLDEATGWSFKDYLQQYAPRYRKQFAQGWEPEAIFKGRDFQPGSTMEFIAKHMQDYRTPLDPNDDNLLRVSATWLRYASQDKNLGRAVSEARQLANLKTADGSYVTGTLQPLLMRHIDNILGRPDVTQRALQGALLHVRDIINEGIGKVNEHLPDSHQIEPMEDTPNELLGKYLMLSYAGGMGLRPMIYVRDSLMPFITTFPIAGNYIWKGLGKAFEYTREGTESDAYKLADQYNVLLHENELPNLFASGDTAGQPSRITQAAQSVLKPLIWTNNVNRLSAWFAYTQKIEDALKRYASDPEKLASKSGLWALNKGDKDAFLKEIADATPDQYTDIARRAGRQLVDVSNWNYTRGAQPGIHKYALGRLFGQYGTWPLNYIEFARRIALNGSGTDRLQALGRLVLAHGAILKAGEAMGIDTGQWVFTQPMAYGGGPLMQAVTNIPQTMDFESYQGKEARQEVRRLVFPGLVPGGVAMSKALGAISRDDPDTWKILMGFTPMKGQEADQGFHGILPP